MLIGLAASSIGNPPVDSSATLPLHWATKKQNCVSASSFESEYIALSHAARETALMKRQTESIMELAIPAGVLCDNQAAETVAKGGDGYVR
jgi:hypothetical protein